jgi:four helix bundle protein
MDEGSWGMFTFEKLEVWRLALEYIDLIYALAAKLPESEKDNLQSQMRRAATSIALNIAQGATGQSDAEQARFLGLAFRSLLETVACQHLISRRSYLADAAPLRNAYRQSEILAKELQVMRNAMAPERPSVRENGEESEGGDGS